MQLKKLFLTTLLITSTATFAMMCPSNFQQINIGDTVEKVIAQCGKPASQVNSSDLPDKPQEWVYFLKLNPTDVGTVRTTIAVIQDRVTNITVNGVGITTTSICNNNTVTVGDSAKSVKAACGDPALVNESNAPASPASITKINQLIYMNPNKTVLIFENGRLKARE